MLNVKLVSDVMRRALRHLWRVFMRRTDFLDQYPIWHQAYYLVSNPWHFASRDELYRFEETSRVIERIIGELDLIVELGCGEGHQSKFLERNTKRLIGYDVSLRAIQRAKKRCPESDFIRADLNGGIPEIIPGVGKNLIIAAELLYYFKNPAEIVDQMLASNAQVLLSIYQRKQDGLKDLLIESGFSNIHNIYVNSQSWGLYWFAHDRN